MIDAPLLVPLGVALIEVIVALRVFHGAVGRAMRSRGMPWRLVDSALVSPLLLVGLFIFFAALNLGLRGVAPVAVVSSAATVGLAIAWFGGRAVGKLY